MSAPSRIARSLSHTAGSITHSRLVKVPKPQSVDAITRSRSPTAAHRFLDAARHHFRMLDEIAGGLHHAGDQQHVLRQRMFLERLVFMRVARIGELDRQRADLGLIERRQNGGERHVVDMRAFPVAVADMQPHAVARNAVDAVVDRLHVPLDRLDEIRRPTDRGTSWCGPWRDRARRSAAADRLCGSPGIRSSSRARSR